VLAVYLYNPAALLFATIFMLLSEPKTSSERCGRDRSKLTLLGTLPRCLNRTVCSLVTIVTELPRFFCSLTTQKIESDSQECMAVFVRQRPSDIVRLLALLSLNRPYSVFAVPTGTLRLPRRRFCLLFLQLKSKCQGMPSKDRHGLHSSQLGNNFYAVSSSLIFV